MSFSGHKARRRFGQHWLKDGSVLDKIVAAADLNSQDRVLEIGPGRGALTEKLLESEASVVHAIELDRDLVSGLKDKFEGNPKFSLYEGDALSGPLRPPDGMPINKVVANIPYNITSPLFDRLLGRLDRPPSERFQRLVILLQREVAQRILAKAGNSSFSAISVRFQLAAKCRGVCNVPPSAFTPKPKVESQVIVLDPIEANKRLDFEIAQRLESLLKIAFTSRRKMLRNSLSGLSIFSELNDISSKIGVEFKQRPQELSPKAWLDLAIAWNEIDNNL